MSTSNRQVSSNNGGNGPESEEEFTATQLNINTSGTDDLLDEIDGLLENLSLIHI